MPRPKTPVFLAALIEDLTAHRTAALQAMLGGNPKVALIAIAHALALDCLYTTSVASCIKVRGSTTDLNRSAEGIDDSAASKAFAATVKNVTKGMPKQREKLWAWPARSRKPCWRSLPSVPDVPWIP